MSYSSSEIHIEIFEPIGDGVISLIVGEGMYTTFYDGECHHNLNLGNLFNLIRNNLDYLDVE